MDTSSIRSSIKQKRTALTADVRLRYSESIANHLLITEEFIQARHIAYYIAVNGEADPEPLITKSAASDKTFYLPVVHNGDEVGLNFVKVDSTTDFKTNQFSIPEPVHCAEDEIQPHQLDLIVTPLVSFDDHGNRIGMGGGFYDRTFAFKLGGGANCKPLLIGYAYDFQRSANIQSEVWDVALDGIVTESRFKRFGSGN